MMRMVVAGITFLMAGCNPCEDTFTVNWTTPSESYLAEVVLDDVEASFNVVGGDVTDLSDGIVIDSASSTSFTLVGIPSHIEVTIIDNGTEIAHGSADPEAPAADGCTSGTLDL